MMLERAESEQEARNAAVRLAGAGAAAPNEKPPAGAAAAGAGAVAVGRDIASEWHGGSESAALAEQLDARLEARLDAKLDKLLGSRVDQMLAQQAQTRGQVAALEKKLARLDTLAHAVSGINHTLKRAAQGNRDEAAQRQQARTKPKVKPAPGSGGLEA